MHNTELAFGKRGRKIYIRLEDKQRAEKWLANGYDEIMKTPDDTVIFVAKSKADEIILDQINCMGCLSHCRFSNWKDRDDFTTGKKSDPRSFCIQKTLQNIINGEEIDNNLMFSGHNAYRFATDPFYANGFIPTVKQLVDRIASGY
jgi:nitronate monooxygenase